MKVLRVTSTLSDNIDYEKECLINDKQITTDYFHVNSILSFYNKKDKEKRIIKKKIIDCDLDNDILIVGPHDVIILEIKHVNIDDFK